MQLPMASHIAVSNATTEPLQPAEYKWDLIVGQQLYRCDPETSIVSQDNQEF